MYIYFVWHVAIAIDTLLVWTNVPDFTLPGQIYTSRFLENSDGSQV